MVTVAIDHITSQTDVQWSSLVPQATPLMPLSGPTGSVYGWTKSGKGHL